MVASNKSLLWTILAVLCLVSVTGKYQRLRYYYRDFLKKPKQVRLGEETLEVEQKLDHFNDSDTRTWLQSATKIDDYYDYEKGGPVFLYLNGEGPTADGFVMDFESFNWLQNAQRHHALAFQIAHRYYSEYPLVPDLSTENLKYLSSMQALADMAHFIEYMNKNMSLAADTKWVVFGGSYPGALAAWAREKYPNLVYASVASSAVVYATLDNYGYLDVVSSDLLQVSPQCYNIIKEATAELEANLETAEGRQKINDHYKPCVPIDSATSNNAVQFFNTLGENWMGLAQYDGPSAMKDQCDQLVASDGSTAYEKYARFVSQFQCVDNNYDAYIATMNDTAWQTQSFRGWYYQKCSEVGYFKTSTGPKSIFGSKVTIEFMQQQCRYLFGPQFTLEYTAKGINNTLAYYGGTPFKTTRIFMPNGAFDPWHAVSVTQSDDPDLLAYVIKDGTHCSDMYAMNDQRFKASLNVGQRLIEMHLDEWLSG
jgi:pimeloyl-ACP methyl ester carboxylesterase